MRRVGAAAVALSIASLGLVISLSSQGKPPAGASSTKLAKGHHSHIDGFETGSASASAAEPAPMEPTASTESTASASAQASSTKATGNNAFDYDRLFDGPSIEASTSASVDPSKAPEGAKKEQSQEQRQRGILRVLLGLAATVVLAILAAHPRVRRIENRFGLTIAVASGLPFIILGWVFQLKAIDVLDADLLRALGPFVEFGLGWVGFVLGLEFDVRRLDELPDGVGAVLAAESVVPFFFTAAMGAGFFVFMKDGSIERDSLLLGACAALSAATAPLALARGAGRTVGRILDRVAQLDDVFALIVLLVVGAWFRPVRSNDWQLPAIAWLFVTVGLGGVLGMLSYVLIRGARSEKDELALILGAVALSAGVSGRLSLSPLVVCAVAGALLANLPRKRHGGKLAETLRTVERPLVLLFMLIAGATAPFGQWQTWALTGIWLLGRTAGKAIAARVARKMGPLELRNAPGIELALMPQSPMAIATILGATYLYLITDTPPLGWILGATILGSYVNDVGVQIVAQRVNDVSTAVVEEAARSVIPASAWGEEGEELASTVIPTESLATASDRGGRLIGEARGIPIPPPPPLPNLEGPPTQLGTELGAESEPATEIDPK